MSNDAKKDEPKKDAAEKAEEKKGGVAVLEAPSLSDPLGGVVVKAPATNIAKTRRYFAGIVKDEALERFQFQIRVGPVTFASQTFAWKGKGDLAEQIFRAGAIVDLTEEQVKEVREKLRFRYLRLFKSKDDEGQEFITGFQDIDVSNSGSVVKNADGSETRHPPQEVGGRLRGDELPLVNMLRLVPAAVLDKEFEGQVVTLQMAREIIARAEAEENKAVADPIAYMETGKGGLLEKKAKKDTIATSDKDAARLRRLSTTDGSRKVEGGFLAD